MINFTKINIIVGKDIKDQLSRLKLCSLLPIEDGDNVDVTWIPECSVPYGKIAEYIKDLVATIANANNQIAVLITDSPDIVKEINNYLMVLYCTETTPLGQEKRDIIHQAVATLGHNIPQQLKLKDFSAFILNEITGEVSSLDVTDEGFIVDFFEEEIRRSNQSSNELFYTLEELMEEFKLDKETARMESIRRKISSVMDDVAWKFCNSTTLPEDELLTTFLDNVRSSVPPLVYRNEN